MTLQTWVVQGETSEAIIVATDEHWATTYARQMGFKGALQLINVPTVFIRELESEELF